MSDPDRPQVYVNVSGGVAEATVTRGDAEVIVFDWDEVEEEREPEVLERLRPRLEAVADERYRNRLLADLDDEIVGRRRDIEERAEAREKHHQRRLQEARDLLRAEGEIE